MGFKIKKVEIEGEMPVICFECPVFSYEEVLAPNNNHWVCLAANWRAVGDKFSARPDWCPLVVEGEYATEVVREYLKMVDESEVE